jgi:hypothetical protein
MVACCRGYAHVKQVAGAARGVLEQALTMLSPGTLESAVPEVRVHGCVCVCTFQAPLLTRPPPPPPPTLHLGQSFFRCSAAPTCCQSGWHDTEYGDTDTVNAPMHLHLMQSSIVLDSPCN